MWNIQWKADVCGSRKKQSYPHVSQQRALGAKSQAAVRVEMAEREEERGKRYDKGLANQRKQDPHLQAEKQRQRKSTGIGVRRPIMQATKHARCCCRGTTSEHVQP